MAGAGAEALNSSTPSAGFQSQSPWAKPLVWVLAVDGSKGSRACFEDVCTLSRAGDKVHVVTVQSSKEKTYLPHDEQPKAVKEYYSARCAGHWSKDSYTVTIIDRKEGEDTPKALLSHLHRKVPEADFMVVGFVGRKGSKGDPTVFGSVTDMCLRAAHISSVVSKNQASADTNHFFVCVDGSDCAHDGVELAVRLMRDTDRCTVIFIDDPSNRSSKSKFTAEVVEARYAAFATVHPQVLFRIVTKGREQGIADTLLAAAEDVATHIVCGVTGLGGLAAGKDNLGTTSDRIVRGSTCSVICVQPKFSTHDGS